ncbi:16168_t:CDS:2, partial [Racocetra fulgida]
PNNTNVAEAAHALNNQCEKGYKLDKERFTMINIHQQYNIPQQGFTESEDTNESSNEGSSKSDKLEYLEQKLALKECELDLQERGKSSFN